MEWSYPKVRKRINKKIRVSEDCVPILNKLPERTVRKIFDYVNKNGKFVSTFNSLAVNHILEILGEKNE